MKPKNARQPILPFDSPPPAADATAPSVAPPAASSPRVASASPAPVSSSPSSPAKGLLNGFLPEILLIAAAIVLLGVGIGSVPLLDPDEARYASASRAMLERGDLVVPYFNGAERLNKPALFYWLQAASFRLFGTTAAAARVPSVVAALVVLVAVVLFARRTFGARAGRYAGLILLTLPLFAVVGKTGITDMALAACTVGALLLWYELHVGGSDRRRLLWLGVSLCLGLGFFVKGPVGILLPCFVIASYLVMRGEWSGFRLRGTVLGGLVAFAVFMPWAGLLLYRLGSEVTATPATADVSAGSGGPTGPIAAQVAPAAQATIAQGLAPVLLAGLGRVSDLLRRETVERTLHGLDHPEPLHYYWLASLVIFFPWIAWVPPAIARAWPRLRSREPATLYLVTWLLGVLVFFTVIRGKLVTYVLPAAPAIALLLGREWASLRDRWSRPSEGGSGPATDDRPAGPSGKAARDPVAASSEPWVTAGSIGLVAAMIVLIGYAAVASPFWIEGRFAFAGALALALALAAAVPVFLGRPTRVVVAVAAVMGVALVAVPLLAGRALGESRSLERLAVEADIREGPWSGVLGFRVFHPSLVFYGGREVVYIGTTPALRNALTPRCLVILEQRRFDELPASLQSDLRTVATQGDVLAMTPVTLLSSASGGAGGAGEAGEAGGRGGDGAGNGGGRDDGIEPMAPER